MDDSTRLGISYSLFAGAVAFVLQLLLFALAGQKFPEPLTLIFIALSTAGAFVSARLAGLLALRGQQSDHGFAAAIFTWLIFSVFLALLVLGFMFHEFLTPPPYASGARYTWREFGQIVSDGLFIVVYISPLVILPACLVGTMLFHASLLVLGRTRATTG